MAQPSRPLTPKQRRFVDEYLLDLNATQAAIRAGYSERTANEIGAENLAKPSIAAAVEAALAKRAHRAEVSADRVLAEIDGVALSDVGQLFDLDADALRLLPMKAWPEVARRAVASVKAKVYPEKLPPISAADADELRKLCDTLVAPEAVRLLKRIADAIEETRWDQYTVLEIKLWDKNAALTNAGRHRKLFTDQVDLTSGGAPLRFTFALNDDARDAA